MLFLFIPKILFENRKIGDTFNNCLMSIDGTDFQIAMSYCPQYHSFKFKKSGLRYEVGLNIHTGDICWIFGPFPAGQYNDLMIFNMALRGDLEHGEHVETDSGYKGALPDVNCPEFTVPSRQGMTARVRS